MTRRLRVLAVLGALGLSVLGAGCSSDDDTSAADATDTSTTVAEEPATSTTVGGGELTLTSSAFADGEEIPGAHACPAAGGVGSSPPLEWSGVPDDAATLVLVVHDPDAPIDGGFTHQVTAFPADGESGGFAAAANEGGGPMGEWVPMCPPTGTHRYVFTLSAFGPDVKVAADATKADIDDMAGDALATAELTGRFTKPA